MIDRLKIFRANLLPNLCTFQIFALLILLAVVINEVSPFFYNRTLQGYLRVYGFERATLMFRMALLDVVGILAAYHRWHWLAWLLPFRLIVTLMVPPLHRFNIAMGSGSGVGLCMAVTEVIIQVLSVLYLIDLLFTLTKRLSLKFRSRKLIP